MIHALRETKCEIIAIGICLLLIIISVIVVRTVNKYEEFNISSSQEQKETKNIGSQTSLTTEVSTVPKLMESLPTTEPATTSSTGFSYVTADSLAELKIDGATIDRIAGICYGEARGASYTEICKVVWCICNRADAWGQSLWEVATMPNQFCYVPVLTYRDVAVDVLSRWLLEKEGVAVQRELDKGYLYFTGDGKINHYRSTY